MAVNLHLMPAKGMTLPFISYGGSSLISLGIGMGFLIALTRKRPHRRSARPLAGAPVGTPRNERGQLHPRRRRAAPAAICFPAAGARRAR